MTSPILGRKTTSSENNQPHPPIDQSLVDEINRANQLFREMAGGGCGQPVADDPFIEKMQQTKDK